jgi:hypothetical protein
MDIGIHARADLVSCETHDVPMPAFRRRIVCSVSPCVAKREKTKLYEVVKEYRRLGPPAPAPVHHSDRCCMSQS